MHSIEALKLLPVWVNSDHLVSTARIVLQGHGLRALAVVDEGRLLGVLSPEKLSAAPDNTPVQAVMEQPQLVIECGETIRHVAEQFVQLGLDYAPVKTGDRFLGIVTANMLLRELGRSWDPLTGLSWSDRLREWGVEHLKRGSEITILFIDLDDFGSYNKRFGHIVGDKVLQLVSGMLSSSLAPDGDVIVRYGGDEFAIGTTRPRPEAEALAAMIQRKAQEIFLGETHQPVQFSVGISGGKRTKERENVHYAATMDNLINQASRDCIAKKPLKAEDQNGPQAVAVLNEPAEPAPELPKKPDVVRVVGVYADEQANNSLTQVILSVGENVVSGITARMGKPVIESVAIATTKALERAFPEAPMRIQDIHMSESAEGQRIVTVAGQLQSGDKAVPVGGVETVEKDLYKSVAEATLQAFLSSWSLR